MHGYGVGDKGAKDPSWASKGMVHADIKPENFLVIADPPYNIAVQDAPWDTVPDYMAWSAGWLKACVAALRPGGALFILSLIHI